MYLEDLPHLHVLQRFREELLQVLFGHTLRQLYQLVEVDSAEPLSECHQHMLVLQKPML